MAGGGPGNSTTSNSFEARLKTDLGGVSGTLTLLQYKGNKILVNGQIVTVPNAGMTRAIGDNLITGAGAVAGVPAANTLYYVYVSNSRASFSPSSIRLSASAPVLVNGVKYLNNSGNGKNWRFVGWVRPNTTPNFESSLTKRRIVNYYNREIIELFTCPGYVNDNTITTWSTTSTTFEKANAGTGSDVDFISNGEDAAHFAANGNVDTGATVIAYMGIGRDGITDVPVAGLAAPLAARESVSCEDNHLYAEGSHTVSMVVRISAAGAGMFIADADRGGATADPAITYLTGTVLV